LVDRTARYTDVAVVLRSARGFPEALMTTLLLEQFLATVTLALPRLFLVGAPILVVVALIAAVVDTRMPGTSTHVP
jgi:hypothetical protein